MRKTLITGRKYIVVFTAALLITFVSIPSESSAFTVPGNPDGYAPIPAEAKEADVSKPDHIIGTGTPESCTSEAFVKAVAEGGTIVFNGGSKPFTLTLKETAKVFNNKPDIVIDGGGLVTLSGGGKHRILYMNTCDPDQVWTTDHAQNQDHPHLTVQNITFANGNSKNETKYDGGGAVWVRGGRFKAVNCRFINNVCASSGPDVGGGAIRVFDQYEDLPVYIVNSTFGGAKGLGNIGANGGAISSIGVSWTIINSLFSYNEAVGNGGNPATSGSPGGGSGGAIYNDGNRMTLKLLGCRLEYNKVNAFGSGIFFVTNDHTGDIRLDNTVIENNIGGSWYPVVPEISMHSDTKITITHSPVTKSERVYAAPAASKILIDGKEVNLGAYNINDNNYFKLRDVSKLLSGTKKQFDVVWDAGAKAIKMTSGKEYSLAGEELTSPKTQGLTVCSPSQSAIILDGNEIVLTAYTINNSNYFKLRDIASVINFGVSWDAGTGSIVIDTGKGYENQ